MIGIVGHTDRRQMAEHLAHTVHADYLSLDDGTLGCEGNHRKVWANLADSTDKWTVVLEDDALPVDGFNDQLTAALAIAPAPIVSLYLGTSYPTTWQPRIRAVMANTDAHWLIGSTLLHAVAVAIRTELVSTMRFHSHLPIDAAISNWAKQTGHQVAYTVPSICDHADTTPVITQRHSIHTDRTQPRHAHRIGTRACWTNRIAPL